MTKTLSSGSKFKLVKPGTFQLSLFLLLFYWHVRGKKIEALFISLWGNLKIHTPEENSDIICSTISMDVGSNQTGGSGSLSPCQSNSTIPVLPSPL